MENSIFFFNDSLALQVQDAAACEKMYGEIWDTAINAEAPFDRFLPRKTALVSMKSAFTCVAWYPSYASAVLIRPLNALDSTVGLVGLDNWTTFVHASVHGRETTATPDVCRALFFLTGCVPSNSVDELMGAFSGALSKSESESTGSMRGHGLNHRGNQKTPSFAFSVLRSSMARILPEERRGLLARDTTTVQGGTTDVGLHTGCIRRNTSFPLVLSTICRILQLQGQPSDECFHKMVVLYKLEYLEKVAKTINKFQLRLVDRAVAIVRSIEKNIGSIADKDFVGLVTEKVATHHTRLLDLRPRRLENGILHLGSVEDVCSTLCSPPFPQVPSLSATTDFETRMQQARSEAEKNLKWSNIEASEFTGKMQDSLVQINRFNKFIWCIADELHGSKHTIATVENLKVRLAAFCRHIEFVVTGTLDNPNVMSVVFRSYGMLATWICYCCAHSVAESAHPVFQGCRCTLNPDDLRHAVLDDAGAVLALEKVRSFLIARRTHAQRPFKCHEDSLSFAERFGLSTALLQEIHKREFQRALELIDERWQRVQKIQRELLQLDPQLEQANHDATLATAARNLSELRDYKWESYTYRLGHAQRKKVYLPRYAEAQAKETACNRRVASLKQKIATLESKKPGQLCCALPRDLNISLQWLFFLFMPLEFRLLVFFAQRSESQLWRSPPMASESANRKLSGWYTQNRKVRQGKCTEGQLWLGSPHTKEPSNNLPNIRCFSRETGVYFPDSFQRNTIWSGADPFNGQRSLHSTIDLFTEELPRTAHNRGYMQQFVALFPSTVRENQGIARIEEKPDWLSSEQHLYFTSLREGPYSQLRNFAHVVYENLLPFGNHCVHVIVKQLLFEVGEADCREAVCLDESMSVLFTGITEIIERIRESPKDFDVLILIGEVCSFLGQVHPDFWDSAKMLSKIARSLGKGIDQEIRNAGNEFAPLSVLGQLYGKRACLYGASILCLGLGGLSAEDCRQLAELALLFHQSHLFARVGGDCKNLENLEFAVANVLTRRLKRLLDVVNQEPRLLSSFLSLVVDDVPEGLSWKAVQYPNAESTGCFEAFSGHHFAINLLNGTVLVDGIPPGFLPTSVVEDPLFVRTFGHRNFEMVVLGFRHFRTARTVDQHYLYEFFIDSSDQLHITEVDVDHGEPRCRRLLLNRAHVGLPIIFQEAHSHWYYAQKDVVVVRGVQYLDRSCFAVMTRDDTYVIASDKLCVASLDDILLDLDSNEQLLLGETQLSLQVRRFESPQFLHLTVDKQKTLFRWRLPRFGLTFVLRDEVISCLQFDGFHLQHFDCVGDTMVGLNYLLAIRNANGDEKVLVTSGVVSTDAEISFSDKWNVACSFHVFDIHRRFRHLMAQDSVGRLHLAALYAATSCELVERRTRRRGTDVAVDLLRRSWKNEPLSDLEAAKLLEVFKLSSLSCTLNVMCYWLYRSSQSLVRLHGDDSVNVPELTQPDPQAFREYEENPYCYRLSSNDELGIFQRHSSRQNYTSLRGSELSNTEKLVREMERVLCETYVEEVENTQPAESFPLDNVIDGGKLERRMYSDLKRSYVSFAAKRRKLLVAPVSLSKLSEFDKTARLGRERLETEIVNRMQQGDATLRLSGRLPYASPMDILRCMVDDETLELLNPLLGLNERKQLRLRCLDWAVLCVFEDKCLRLRSFIASNDTSSIMHEVQCQRGFRPADHPRWLAFEVEQQLQIRPVQYNIVHQLLHQPKSVIQLNMGLGKTRVLVPMLILELSSGEKVVRINLLAAIFSEAKEYYRNVLVDSIANVKLFTMPFSRSVVLDEATGELLKGAASECIRYSGCMLVTPQDRNSMLLKQYETNVMVGLDDDAVDILDESDAILSHDFQLVYALGTQTPLPDGPARWLALQALIRTLSRSSNEQLADFFSDCAVQARSYRGSYKQVRLLHGCRCRQQDFNRILCSELLRNPPHELRWMELLDEASKLSLVEVLSDPEHSNVLRVMKSNPIFVRNNSTILALRGFASYGILFHGLEARHRVHYGLNPNMATRLAVPFSASDTPKEHSQYSHPDMALAYTALSYYYEGLDQTQMRCALKCLLSMGENARATIYKEWIEAVQNDAISHDLQKFDSVDKVDLGNKLQFALIWEHLHLCMEVVEFWTNQFLYPSDTAQFLSRRSSSAWSLAESSNTIGFSGTDDNRFLLPLSVQQIEPNSSDLTTTNGMMVDKILSCADSRIVVIEPSCVEEPLWKSVLKKCTDKDVDALIDVGGLMAGSSNREVAEALAELSRRKRSLRGIVFFDNGSMDDWCVLDLDTKRTSKLQTSPIAESECMVYFDQSRCRGVDMKLKRNAVAFVTLEPKLTKDRFLQGCARMRRLPPDGQQGLILAGTPETVSSSSTVRTVLAEIVRQTATAIKKGIPTFVDRGLCHFSFPRPSDDDISLESMYSAPVSSYRTMTEYLDMRFEVESAEQSSTDSFGSMRVNQLRDHCELLGQGMSIESGGLNEECEQELEQQQEEEEEEEELEVAKQQPYSQVDWPFQRALDDDNDGFFSQHFLPLKHFVSSRLCPSSKESLASLDWTANLFCTHNFWQTIQHSQSTNNLSLYVRPVNGLLVYNRTGRIVLISTYELEQLLPIWLKKVAATRQRKKPRVALAHSFLLDAESGFGYDGVNISSETLAMLRLFRGYANFSTEEKLHLRKVFSDVTEPKKIARRLLSIRHRLGHFDRSDLETICTMISHSPRSVATSPDLISELISGNISWNAGDADRAFRLGVQLEKNGQARKATSAFHEAATLYQCCIDQPEAFGHVTSFTDIDKRRTILAYTCLSLGYLHLDAQRDAPKAAARLYQLASANVPTAVSWDGRGQALEAAGAGSLDTAVAAYRQALAYDGAYTPAQFHLAVALDRMEGEEEKEEAARMLNDLRRSEVSVCLVDSWGYCRWHMRKEPKANFYRGTRDMIELALQNAILEGEDGDALVCEFGVGSGRTLRMTQEVLDLSQEMHGFDTFTGLPQPWGLEPIGTYSTGGVVPNIEGKVVFHKGLFRDTIKPFLEQVRPTAFLSYANIDCRLYTSTIDILEGLHSRVVPGTIIMFSEYICHPTWRQDEFRAWRECCKRFGWKYEYIAFSLNTRNVVVRVTHA